VQACNKRRIITDLNCMFACLTLHIPFTITYAASPLLLPSVGTLHHLLFYPILVGAGHFYHIGVIIHELGHRMRFHLTPLLPGNTAYQQWSAWKTLLS
jgi:hypothetical protein